VNASTVQIATHRTPMLPHHENFPCKAHLHPPARTVPHRLLCLILRLIFACLPLPSPLPFLFLAQQRRADLTYLVALGAVWCGAT